MKLLACMCIAAGTLLACGSLRAQGLLAIGQHTDYSESVPLTYTVRLSSGYDDVHYSVPSLGQPNFSSFFVQGGVGLAYVDNSKPTPWSVGLDLGLLHYFDNEPGTKDIYYNTRLSFNITHEFDRRLKVSDNFYVAYELDPDYGVGVSTGAFSGQYLYGYNNLNVAYAWTERFSTTTSYTLDGIHYTQDATVADMEDHLEHIISQQFAYQLSRTTTVTGEYRFGLVRYSSGVVNSSTTSPNYTSHYLLAGVDQAWSPRLSSSLRAGAQFYESDREHKVAPYAEGSLDYKVSRKTNVRFYAQAGYDPSDLGDYAAHYAIHTGVTGNYKVTDTLSLSAGLHYVHGDYTGSGSLVGFNENEVDASAGITYSLWKNVAVDASYSYTTIASDIDTRSYDRSRVNLGFNATF